MTTNGYGRKHCMLLIVILISACSSTFPKGISDNTYKSYPGEVLSPNEVATIQMGKNIEWVQVDDGEKVLHQNYGSVTVLPGEYRVKWGTIFAVSALLKFSGIDTRTWSGVIDMKPSKTYTIVSERTTGPGYNVRVKVEESDGQTVRNITNEIKEGGQISSDN